MKIGVPKEIKPQENRIGLTPDSVKTLVSEGHEVIVENNGGFEEVMANPYVKSVYLGEEIELDQDDLNAEANA